MLDGIVKSALTAACALSLSAGHASACAYELGNISGLDVAYPGSLGVAVAISGARAKGDLPSMDVSQSALGFMFASKRLEMLGQELAEDYEDNDTSFSMVFASSRLWTAYEDSDTTLTTRVHADGPLDGKPVVVTDFLVIDAILRGEMTVDSALEMGLMVIKEDSDGRVARLFEKAFHEA